MCAIGSRAALLLLFAAAARADDAPAIFQSTPNFTNAIAGAGFAVNWTADPTTLSADGEIQLAIRFVGVANPDRVRRPDLSSTPSFKSAFREIGSIPGGSTAGGTVEFRYRLRPRDARVDAIPELAVAYYSPGSESVATKYLDAIPLVVQPPVAKPRVARPLDAPERFFALPDLDAQPWQPGMAAWGSLAIALILVALLGVAFERYRNPDGAHLARLRRIRAVRSVLDELDRAARSPDPAGAALEALRGYLAARHGAVAVAATPSDFVHSLESALVSQDRIDTVRELASAGDAERFASERSAADLVPRIRRLILEWESAT
jgi:hypothetical protein